MLTFNEIHNGNIILIDTDKQYYECTELGRINPVIKNGDGYEYFDHTGNSTNMGLLPLLSSCARITTLIDDKSMIEVWASGGEMPGYLDNNLAYFLELDEAITHLQWALDYLEYELVESDVELFSLDNEIIRQHCLIHGGSYMGYTVDNFSYSIYKTQIRLIDYLLAELE